MRLLTMLAMLLLMACGGEPQPEAPAQDEPPEVEPDREPDLPEPEEPTEEGDVLEGTLGGDPQLEGGCAWLDADGTRYEVVWPDGYEVTFDPLRLQGPDGQVVAEEGDTVRVRGGVDPDLLSVCQVGQIYAATEVVRD